MIVRKLLNLIVIGAIAVTMMTICHGSVLNSNEEEAKMFLNQISDKLFSFYDTRSTSFGYISSRSADLTEYKFLQKIVNDSKNFDFENFKNKELTYAFKTLFQIADLKIIGRVKFLNLRDYLKGLERLEYDEYTAELSDSSNEINLLSYSQTKNIIVKSSDLKELQYYWNGWWKINIWGDLSLDVTLEALKKAADLTKMSPLEFWLRGYNIAEMENLMTDIKPLYMELHAFIRNLLQKKYGESIIGANGLIPEYLLDQVLLQAQTTNMSIIEEMFPYESLPPVKLREFKAKQLYEIADGFYESLGFEKYPPSIWGYRIRPKAFDDDTIEEDDSAGIVYDSEEEEDDKDVKKVHDNDDKDDHDENFFDDDECHPALWYSTPHVGLKYCEKPKFRDFIEAYADMGYLYYAKEMIGLPGYFFKPPHGLEYAIGKAVTLSSSTHHNLKAIGMIPEDFNITNEVEMNRLIRMAFLRILHIPKDFVHIKVMADRVSEKVNETELKNHYWHNMNKYAGVGRPRNETFVNDYILPSSFYEGMAENSKSTYLTTDVLSYQIHKKLCELSGKYPKEPLHLCDIKGSKDAGNALKKMMQLGSSKPFKDVLATMFPENPTVKAEGLLEYYKPLKELLVEMNQKSNVSAGWKY